MGAERSGLEKYWGVEVSRGDKVPDESKMLRMNQYSYCFYLSRICVE